MERLAVLEVTLLALAPALAGTPHRERYDELRARVQEARGQAREGRVPADAIARLDTDIQTLINDARAAGTSVPVIESTFGELLLVHSAERSDIDLETAIYTISGWSTKGAGSRMELRRLLPAGRHSLAIDGISGQQSFSMTLPFEVTAKRQTLVACDTESDGIALDLICTVNGVAVDAIGEPTAMGGAPQLVDDDPVGMPEPVEMDAAAREDTGGGFSDPTAGVSEPSAQASSGLAAPGDEAALREQLTALATQATSLREQLKETRVNDEEMKRELDGYLAALQQEIATVQQRQNVSSESSGELSTQAEVTQIATRLSSLALVVNLFAAMK